MNKLFLSTLLLTFSSLFAFAQPSPQVIDGIVAIVGNEIILQSEITNQQNQLKAQYKVDAQPCDIIEDILLDRLMLNQAKLDSVEVTEQQVEQELDRRIRYYINLFGSQEKMEQTYGQSIIEIKEEFRDQLKDQLRVQMMQGKITEDVNITPADVKKFFENIPVDSLPLINAEVEVAQIVIYPAENRDEVKKAIDKLERIKKDIQGGKDFATQAVLYSEDPGSAAQGGELGMQEKGSFVPEFDAVALSLRDGELSKVFKSQFGYHLMQMIERRGEKYNARHILIKPKSRPEDLAYARLKLDSIASVMKRDTMSFEKAAQKFSQDEDSKNGGGVIVNPATGSSRFDMRDLDPQLFFTIDKMEVGEISVPVLMTSPAGQQGYRILQLKERTKPHRANLREDYQTIQDAASSELRTKALNEWVLKKIETTYVKLSDEYKNCETDYNWLKKKQWVLQ